MSSVKQMISDFKSYNVIQGRQGLMLLDYCQRSLKQHVSHIFVKSAESGFNFGWANLYFLYTYTITYHFSKSPGATAGCSDDWAKGTCNIKFAYTLELRDTGFYGFQLPDTQVKLNLSFTVTSSCQQLLRYCKYMFGLS